MALRTPPSFLQNGSHPAEQDRLTTQGLFRTSGILSAADLAVTQSTVPAMSVQIALGWGNIIGTTQANMGAYQYYNDAAATATITTADVTNPRIDLICITINDAYYTGVTNNVAINVVAGTPAASPAVPTLPANSYALAQVAVAANATTITNANITDLRQVSYLVNTKASAAGSNAINNSGFDIWQRGTSVAVAASSTAYTADRFQIATGVNQACTISQQPTSDTVNLPFIKSCIRIQRNSGQTGTAIINLAQSLETTNSIPFVGKTVVFSYYARAGSNYSGSANALGAYVYTGTGTDQGVISGYTGGAIPGNASSTLTTTWTRFQGVATISNSTTEIAVSFQFTPTGTAGVNDYFEITGVMLELGSTPTSFSRAGGSIGGEIQLANRYLPNFIGIGDEIQGFAISATQSRFSIPLSTVARLAATGVTISNLAHFTIDNQALGTGTPTAIAFNSAGNNSLTVLVTTVAATPTLVTGQPVLLVINNALGSIIGTGVEL